MILASVSNLPDIFFESILFEAYNLVCVLGRIFMTFFEQEKNIKASKQEAYNIVKEILNEKSKVAAVISGVKNYTNDLEVEFADIDAVLNSTDMSVFDTNFGVAFKLWGAIHRELMNGQIIDSSTFTEEQLKTLISKEYTQTSSGT